MKDANDRVTRELPLKAIRDASDDPLGRVLFQKRARLLAGARIAHRERDERNAWMLLLQWGGLA